MTSPEPGPEHWTPRPWQAILFIVAFVAAAWLARILMAEGMGSASISVLVCAVVGLAYGLAPHKVRKLPGRFAASFDQIAVPGDDDPTYTHTWAGRTKRTVDYVFLRTLMLVFLGAPVAVLWMFVSLNDGAVALVLVFYAGMAVGLLWLLLNLLLDPVLRLDPIYRKAQERDHAATVADIRRMKLQKKSRSTRAEGNLGDYAGHGALAAMDDLDSDDGDGGE